jgi:hypothetical protein
MKFNSDTVRKLLAYGLVGIQFGSASLAFAVGANRDAIVQTVGGVSYVSGGVGTSSIDRLDSLAKDFNVKLVFALKSGEYVSDVRVTIADAKGGAVLDATSEGPWLLIKLPAGAYRIVATLGGQAVTRLVSVDTAKLKTIDFRWASE